MPSGSGGPAGTRHPGTENRNCVCCSRPGREKDLLHMGVLFLSYQLLPQSRFPSWRGRLPKKAGSEAGYQSDPQGQEDNPPWPAQPSNQLKQYQDKK